MNLRRPRRKRHIAVWASQRGDVRSTVRRRRQTAPRWPCRSRWGRPAAPSRRSRRSTVDASDSPGRHETQSPSARRQGSPHRTCNTTSNTDDCILHGCHTARSMKVSGQSWPVCMTAISAFVYSCQTGMGNLTGVCLFSQDCPETCQNARCRDSRPFWHTRTWTSVQHGGSR